MPPRSDVSIRSGNFKDIRTGRSGYRAPSFPSVFRHMLAGNMAPCHFATSRKITMRPFSTPIATFRKTPWILAACFLVGAALPRFALAAEKCDLLIPSDQFQARGARFKKLLKEKMYAALEDEMQSRQLRIENGGYSDELLRLDIHAAFDSDPAIEPLLGEWIRTYPKSFVARMARARHFVSSGYDKRGSAFANKTSQEQLTAMRLQFEKAAVDLGEALKLSKTPTLVYAERIFVARAIGGEGVVAYLVEDGNRQFPQSLAIKVAAAFALNPKWGGSLEELDQLAASAQGTRMDSGAVRVVKYRVEMEKANYYEIVTKQKARAAEHYRMAGSHCEFGEPWRNAMRMTYDIEDWSGLVTAANRMLELHPTDSGSLQRRGWAYEKLDRMKDAIKDYEAAAALGGSWAQNKLGWMLWQGKGMVKDLPRARRLLEQAAEQGDKNARANLNGLNAELGAR
jgi:tetratricopeptide (TPR) repeat protein